jgi:hypothetical protein
LLKRLGGLQVAITIPPASDWHAPLRGWLERHAPP